MTLVKGQGFQPTFVSKSLPDDVNSKFVMKLCLVVLHIKSFVGVEGAGT